MSEWYKLILISKADIHDRVSMRADTEREAMDLYNLIKEELSNKYKLEVYKQYGSNRDN